MRARGLRLLPAVCVIAGFGLALQPAQAITLGIIGDQTYAVDLDAAYATLQQGVGVLNAQGPLDGVLHVGDIVESTQTPDQIKARFAQVTGILNKLTAPWYLTAGDHDVNPPVFVQNSPDRSREQLFQSLYAQINPLVANRLYYSFNIKGYHFIALYSEEHLDTDPRWGNVFYAQLSDAQLQWLRADLEANKNAPGIVVFLHQPLWYNWSSWTRVHQLLRAYPVAAVVAGHFHYNQDEGSYDGIQYLVVGATGAEIKSASPNAGGVQHVTLLTLNGRQASFTPIAVGKAVNLKFTPRYYMDRVQAIAQMFGNLWNFSSVNPVYLKGNTLVSSCTTGAPAQLQLMALGNPTEMPLGMTVSYNASSPSVKVTQAAFAGDVCQMPQGPFNCVLNPSARVCLANTSDVGVAPNPPCEFSTPPPLWTGALGIDGSPPPVGTTIQLQASLYFQPPGSDQYLVYANASTQVQACSAATIPAKPRPGKPQAPVRLPPTP